MADQVSGLLSPYLRRQRLRAARPYLQGRVLDVGCGVGLLAPMCDRNSYYGMDQDPESIEEARRRRPGYRFGTSLPDRERFDRIIMLALIEHVPQPDQFLSDMHQYLAPGGCMVLTTPNRRFEWVHSLGAQMGACSRAAEQEHQVLFDSHTMRATAAAAGLRIRASRRFLFGMNQLFVLEPSSVVMESPAAAQCA